MNLLPTLAILIGLNAVILWWAFWHQYRQARWSATLVALEVAGYVVVAGLVIHILAR